MWFGINKLGEFMQATDNKCILPKFWTQQKLNFVLPLSSSVCRWQSYYLTHAFVLSVNHICKEEKKKHFAAPRFTEKSVHHWSADSQSFVKSYAYAVDKVCEIIEAIYQVSPQTIAEESDCEKANLFLLTPLVIVKLLLPHALVLVGLQTMEPNRNAISK